VLETPGVDLEAMSEAQLERLYAGLTRLAALPATELQSLVANLLADDGLASSSSSSRVNKEDG
jgi:hypothetical protein